MEYHLTIDWLLGPQDATHADHSTPPNFFICNFFYISKWNFHTLMYEETDTSSYFLSDVEQFIPKPDNFRPSFEHLNGSSSAMYYYDRLFYTYNGGVLYESPIGSLVWFASPMDEEVLMSVGHRIPAIPASIKVPYETPKLYNNYFVLDDEGKKKLQNLFNQHMLAIDKEQLIDSHDIARELANRDYQIQQLEYNHNMLRERIKELVKKD